ncbi:MAG: gamma-glutamyl-gamma-aminobutyrate hydrolase family protein [Myxococcota bacterium]
MAPRIGITTYGPEGSPPGVSLPVTYIEAVERAGAYALLLAPRGLPVEEALALVDGLILAGGGDIAPESYGGAGHETIYSVCPTRDVFEIELVRGALLTDGLPVLGICRGMQLLNVARGGDLEPHIPDTRGERVVHRLPPRNPTAHPVELESASLLHEIFGCREFPVCSWHHQAVRKLGVGLRPVAWAADGVIEGCLLEDHPFALGVQWHPEMQVTDDPLQRRIFEALVEKAGGRR